MMIISKGNITHIQTHTQTYICAPELREVEVKLSKLFAKDRGELLLLLLFYYACLPVHTIGHIQKLRGS